MGDVVIGIACFIGVVVIVLALRMFFVRNREEPLPPPSDTLRTQKDEHGRIDVVRCPVCNTPLAKTDNLASKIFRPMNTPDQRMLVMGCPHCYPVAQAGITRSCPVCKKTIPPDGYLVARLFNHTTSKKHVIITSCSEEQKK